MKRSSSMHSVMMAGVLQHFFSSENPVYAALGKLVYRIYCIFRIPQNLKSARSEIAMHQQRLQELEKLVKASEPRYRIDRTR